MYEKMREELEKVEVYKAWIPQPGDTLMGEIVRKKEKVQTTKGLNDLMVVKTEGGEDITVWYSTTLKELFAQARVGDKVGLKYVGMEQSKAGRDYKNIKYVLEPKQ